MRIDVPDGVDAMAYVTAALGNRELAAAKTTLTKLVYGFSSTLTPRELEAARARLAVINDCTFCMRYRPARDRDGWADDPTAIPEELYAHVEDPDAWSGYSLRERAAIRLAEAFALNHHRRDDELWAEAHRVFTDDEIVDLTNCIAVWFAFGRLNRFLEVDDVCAVPPAEVSRQIASLVATRGDTGS